MDDLSEKIQLIFFKVDFFCLGIFFCLEGFWVGFVLVFFGWGCLGFFFVIAL